MEWDILFLKSISNLTSLESVLLSCYTTAEMFVNPVSVNMDSVSTIRWDMVSAISSGATKLVR